MRCRYCGTRFSTQRTVPPFRAACPKCARITPPMFVERQGDGVSSFREVMIGQNASDCRRKLLETRAYHFTLFLDDDQRIVGFDLMDRDEDHLLKWRRGKPPVFYGVRNTGPAYRNHHAVFIGGRFAAGPVIAELQSCGKNIRDEVRAVLLDGIKAAVAESA